ncbi:hypothetical protein LX97_03332 [Nonlabens dokdonensis]|uniref:Glycoside hydrolase n=2 Tax=Nonlabens dokdonensis TaxID=328515 RepID=A0ABX5PU39_9FLAO|nr:hypothetical protein [Nonlabens dokdonensis]AGC76963.1 putative secreted protein [Nonlabens dokdonensis DSW-6]PZX36867.1 hypothetical protein LX97_03332 [Nonlabens dokdonensis]
MKKILFLLFAIIISSCNSKNKDLVENLNTIPAPGEAKINGISLVATNNPITAPQITPLADFNANYTAIIPYAWMRGLDEPEIFYSEERGDWGEKSNGVKITNQLLNDQGIQAMIKPQLWIRRGDYTGNIELTKEEEWQLLEKTYSSYIMRFVKIAEEKNIPLFCIGTELDSFVEARPKYWNNLIKEIRSIYKGKLTYAANWDNYKRVHFWNDLDYIGVDAYFPMCDLKTPDTKNIDASWKKWKEELAFVSQKHDNKKILFTEYGYISADFAGREPWKNAPKEYEVNQEAQKILYEGLFKNVWNEDWMAGGFFWKYHAEDSRWHGFEKRFTPQDKKAAQIITETYGKSS